MKLLRPLLLVLGLLIGLLALAVGVALVPAVQRWAVLRVAAKYPSLKLEVAEFSVGPSALAIRGLQLTQSGVKVKADTLQADYSVFAFLFKQRLQLDRLIAQGLEIDASRLSRTKTEAGVAAGPAAAPATLGHLVLPYDIAIGTIDVQGRAALPGAPGKPAVQAEFQLAGGQVAPGQEGKIHLKARLVDPAVAAQVPALQVDVALQLKETLQRSFDRIGLDALVEAEGAKPSGRDQLKLAAELVRTATAETYLIKLGTVRDGQAESVLSLDAKLPAGSQTYAGDWTLTAHTSQLTPFLLGATLPQFAARGAGHFTFNSQAQAATVQGTLDGEISELEKLQPALRAFGQVRLRTAFDASYADNVANLRRFELTLAGEQPVLEMAATPATFNFKDLRLQVGGAAGGELVRLKLLGLPLAWVRPFVEGVDLSGGAITGEIAVTATEGFHLSARTVTPMQADSVNVVHAGVALLAKAGVVLDAEAEMSQDGGRFTLRNFQLQTPAGDRVKCTAQVTAPLQAAPPLTVKAEWSGDMPQLLAAYVPFGRISTEGRADFSIHGSRLEVRELKTAVRDAKSATLISLATVRPFKADLQTLRLDAGAPEAELATLGVGLLPLASLARYLPGCQIDGQLTRADYTLAVRGEKIVLQAKAPVRVTGLSLKQNARPLLEQLSIEFSPTVELTGRVLNRFSLGDVFLRDSLDVELAKLTTEMTRANDATQRAAITFNVNLPALGSQPVCAVVANLLAGKASGEIRAALGAAGMQVEARTTLNGLVLRDGNQALPVANISLRAVAQPDGHLTLDVPVLLDRAGQRSDLSLTVNAQRSGSGIAFDAKLGGEQVELGDLLTVLGIFGAPVARVEPDSPVVAAQVLAPPVADAHPFWRGVSGQLALDVKSITRGKDWAMTGLTGRLDIDAARVRLQKLEADFSEKSKLAVSGELAFSVGAKPYALQGDMSLTEFDAGKLFKVLEPGRSPTVEGLFTVKGHASGQGLTLADTLDRVRGQMQVTSRQGVFRGLKRSTDKLSLASKTVGIVGSLIGGKTAEKFASSAVYVDQLAQVLGEFSYDQLSVKLVRDDALNVKLEEFSLVSPDIRLLGAGQITHQAGTPLFEQPLTMSVSLAARNKVEEILGKLHSLDGSRDELGYAKSRDTIVINGTAAKPDPSDFFTKLAASRFTDKLPDFLKLGN